MVSVNRIVKMSISVASMQIAITLSSFNEMEIGMINFLSGIIGHCIDGRKLLTQFSIHVEICSNLSKLPMWLWRVDMEMGMYVF